MRRVAHVLSCCALAVTFPAFAQTEEALQEEDRVFTEEELWPAETEEPYIAECVCHVPHTGRGLYVNRLWPNRTVRYEFAPDISILNQQRTLAAMAELEAVCQVRFVERDEELDYVRIQNGFGNNATLGYTGGFQTLNMFNWSERFIIVHELMHTLGFQHEQSRPDRDQFITVHFENIQPAYHDQYEIASSSFTHGAYDYLSVMHYGPFGFSNGSGPTITTLDPSFQNLIGNRNELSNGDRAALAFLYGAVAFSPNDSCANAIAISGDGIHTFDNSAATEDGVTGGGCPAFSDGIDNDVWFVWTAEATGPCSVSTCGQTDVNTRMAVYQGATCPSGVGLVACSDDSCGFGFEQAQANFTATAGQDYLIRIGTPQGFAGGIGTFTITTLTGGAPNDNCLTAPSIDGFGQWAFDTSNATTDGFGTEACNFFAQPNMEQDVWYSWTSGFTGEVTVSTCGETTVDTKLAVLSGNDCGDPVLICSDDACESLQAQVRFPAVSGETYLIRVGSHPGTPGGEGTLTIEDRPPAPANDFCFDAQVIGLGDTPFSNISASTDGPLAPDLCTPRADVWFVFQPPEDGDYTLSTCGADFDTVLLVYPNASCSVSIDDDVLACNNDSCDLASELTFTAQSNQSYLIRLGGSELAQGSGVLNVAPFVGDPCTCDLVGGDGAVDVFDLLAYLDLWFGMDAAADIDGVAGVDVFDLLSYLDCWFAGCP